MADIVDFRTLPLATEDAFFRRGAATAARQRAYLTFIVGTEEYCIELVRLREIIKARPPTEVPRAPAFIAGVISVRGVVMPVIDLRARLGADPSHATSSRCLVVSRGDELFALRVDHVRHVVQLTEAEIEPAPVMLARAEAEFVAGIGRAAHDPDRLLIVLDLDAALRFELRADRAPSRGTVR